VVIDTLSFREEDHSIVRRDLPPFSDTLADRRSSNLPRRPCATLFEPRCCRPSLPSTCRRWCPQACPWKLYPATSTTNSRG